MTAGWSTWVTRVTASIGAVALIAAGGLFVADRAEAATQTVEGASLSWTVNEESGGGAYFGGCNFLVAGEVPDVGSSHVWTAAEAASIYRTTDGNVTITKPDASGNQIAPTWDNKCKNPAGATVSTGAGSTSGNQVNLTEGVGTVDSESNSASISWDGSFTFVYYGGLTYWSLSDLKLDVVGGVGTLTGTASGYGAAMDDPTKWVVLERTQIDVATLNNVAVTDSGIRITPTYAGVAVDTASAAAQRKDIDGWGSFPQSWIDYSILTGQSAYWYTSGGLADPKKPPQEIAIDYEISTDPHAKPEYSKVPLEYDEGLAITLSNLGDVSGTVSARISGEELPRIGDAPPQIRGGSFSGNWDVAALDLGEHEIEFYLGDETTAPALKNAQGGTLTATISVVEPLGQTQAGLELVSVTNSSAKATWTWPNVEPNTPDGYIYRLRKGTGGEVIQQGSNTSGSYTFDSLAEQTTYTVEVIPTLATTTGTPVTQTFTTTAAPKPGETGDEDDAGEGSDPASDPADVGADGVTLYWGLNKETSGGAYYGGCNFLAAGVAPDTGSSRVWTEEEYQSAADNVTIIKPNSSGQLAQASWSTKCLDRNGSAVSVSGKDSYSESQVQVTNGEVVKNDSTGIRVEWTGGFSVVFYGGLTYWSAADPVLEIDASGNGTLTATASGYAASMQDASKWERLETRTITLANLTNVDIATIASTGGFTHTPDYLDVSYAGTGASQATPGSAETATAQAEKTSENADIWGSFPADFVDFQNETGQFSYWFTSGGARDAYKPALPLTVSFQADYVPNAGSYTGTGSPSLGQTQTNASATGTATPSNAQATPAAPAPTATAPGIADVADSAAGTTQEAAEYLDGQGFSLEVTPAMLAGGGSGLLGVAAANWAVGLIIRRKLGLDPAAYI